MDDLVINPAVGWHYYPPGRGYFPSRTISSPFGQDQIILLRDTYDQHADGRYIITKRLELTYDFLIASPTPDHYTTTTDNCM